MAKYKGYEIDLSDLGDMSCKELNFERCVSWDEITKKIDKHIAAIKKGYPSYDVFVFSGFGFERGKTSLLHSNANIWVKTEKNRQVVMVSSLYKCTDENQAIINKINDIESEIKNKREEVKRLIGALDRFEVTKDILEIESKLNGKE